MKEAVRNIVAVEIIVNLLFQDAIVNLYNVYQKLK
jgi:hypothetical protein